MKNIICPISTDRVEEHIPRITALLVVVTMAAYVYSGFLPIAIIAIADFAARSFHAERYSILGRTAKKVSSSMHLQSKRIDKAPKVFASRLGLIFSTLITLMALAGFQQASFFTSGVLILFATLECVFNLCVGCYIYSWLVLPLYKRA